MSSLNIVIVGNMGQGKSTLTRQLTANVHPSRLNVFDVNNEYENCISHNHGDYERFVSEMKMQRDCVNVFEEATIFFGTKGHNKDLVNMLTRRRHLNQTNILLFHSLRSVPTYILELIDVVYLFNTNDVGEVIRTKFKGFGGFFDAFENAQENEIGEYEVINMSL